MPLDPLAGPKQFPEPLGGSNIFGGKAAAVKKNAGSNFFPILPVAILLHQSQFPSDVPAGRYRNILQMNDLHFIV